MDTSITFRGVVHAEGDHYFPSSLNPQAIRPFAFRSNCGKDGQMENPMFLPTVKGGPIVYKQDGGPAPGE